MAQRTREIGVRIALGAQVRDVLGLVIGQGLRLAIVGCVLGMAGAVALKRFVVSMLYGAEGNDLRVLFGAALLVLVSALLTCWLPARTRSEGRSDGRFAMRVRDAMKCLSGTHQQMRALKVGTFYPELAAPGHLGFTFVESDQPPKTAAFLR